MPSSIVSADATPTVRLTPLRVSPLDLPLGLAPPCGYEILNEIAHGGMGVVYRARQLSLDRVVALKVIRYGDVRYPDAVARFLREAETVAHLDHPHIVPIYEVGEWMVGGVAMPFFSMKLIEGGSLADQLSRFQAHPHRAVALLATVARAVHHAHQHGLLHRDLKPANILLDAEGQPHLTDFGVAKSLLEEADLTGSGLIVGTPRYMAPEQARSGSKLTTAVDVYSLGAVLFELLTGQSAFDAVSSGQVIAEIAHRQPPSPRAVNPRVDRDLETICLKCLQNEPNERYTSAAALADDLDRWALGQPILARRHGVGERLCKWAKRRPILATLSVLLLLSVILGVSGVIWQGHEAEQARQRAETAWTAEQDHRRLAESALRQSERRHYHHRIALAHREWLANHVGRAEQLLDECPLHLRHWEWGYLKRLCHLDTATWKSDHGGLRLVVYRPDGSRIAVAGTDRSVTILDAKTLQVHCRFTMPSSPPRTIAFHPDGQLLATVSVDNELHCWDTETGKEMARPGELPEITYALTFHPDGRRVAVVDQTLSLILWDLKLAKPLRTVGKPMMVFEKPTFSADGRRLAACSSLGEVHVWDVKSGAELFKVKTVGQLCALSLNADGSRVAAAGNARIVRIWDVITGQQLASLAGHTDCIQGLRFSPDGSQLASVSDDRTARFWSLNPAVEPVILRGHTQYVFGVAFAADGRSLATVADDGTLKLWDTSAGSQEATTIVGGGQSVPAMAFTPDGGRVAAGSFDQVIRVYDTITGRELSRLERGTGDWPHLAISPDGKDIAFEQGDHAIRLWRTLDGEHRHLVGLSSCVRSLAFDPVKEHHRLAAASWAHDRPSELRMWDTVTGASQWHVTDLVGQTIGVSFSGKADLLTTLGHTGHLQTWDTATGREIVRWRGHTKQATSLSYRPGSLEVASTAESSEVELWNARTGQPVRTFRGHSGQVNSVAFSPDGQRMATTGIDRTVRVWDVEEGQELLTLDGIEFYGSCVCFSHDGRQIACGCDRGCRIWRAGSWFDPIPNRR
jgi:WD40 repeat protein